MKVLHLVPAMEQGGVETAVLALNRIVVGNGWESVVVSKGGRLVSRLVADGGRHEALDVKSKNPLTYFSRAWKLRNLLKAEQPDLVCAHSRVPAWLFVWANFLFKDGAVTGFFDLEELRKGYPAEYIVRYFTCAMEHLRWYE